MAHFFKYYLLTLFICGAYLVESKVVCTLPIGFGRGAPVRIPYNKIPKRIKTEYFNWEPDLHTFEFICATRQVTKGVKYRVELYKDDIVCKAYVDLDITRTIDDVKVNCGHILV